MIYHNLIIIICFSIYYYFMLVVSARDEIVNQAKPECKVPLNNLQNDNSSRNAQLHSQLVQLKIDPTARIFKLFPALHLEPDECIPSRCYDSMVGGLETDIFEQPIYCTLAWYFDVHYTQHNDSTKLELDLIEKIDNFMENLQSLVKLILHCRDDVHYSKRTRLGLTPFAVYKSNQLVGLYTANLATLDDDSKPSNFSCIDAKSDFETIQPAFADVRNYAQSFVGPIANQLNDSVLCPNSALVYALVGLLESQLLRCTSTNGYESQDPRTNHLLRRLVNCTNSNCESSIGAQTVWKNLFAAACSQTKLAQLLQTGDVMYCEKHKPTDAELMQYLVQYGPLLVYINADEDQFRYYKSDDSIDGQIKSLAFRGKCGGKQANYPVQLVGWRDKYWLVKNSWGEEWGHRGYAFLPIGMNKCNINTLVGVVSIGKCDAFTRGK